MKSFSTRVAIVSLVVGLVLSLAPAGSDIYYEERREAEFEQYQLDYEAEIEQY